MIKSKVQIFLTKSNLLRLIFVLGVIFYLGFGIHKDEIESWDEATNIIVVDELNQSFPKLTLFEEPFFEKPPLWYYLTFFTTKVLGFNNFSLRFITFISASILLFLIWKVAKEKFGEKLAYISIILTLTTGHLFFEHKSIFSTHTFKSADLDALHILFMFASIYVLWKSQNSKSVFLASILSALSFMTKGPLGFLPLLIFLIFQFIYKKNYLLKNLLIILLVTIAIIAPWHLYMFLIYGREFLNEYINYNLFTRSLSPIEDHNEPIFFYFFLLINPLFYPWIILSIVGIIRIFKEKYLSNFFYFSLVTIPIVIFVLFTVIQTKLSWYILPIYPFLILLGVKGILFINTQHKFIFKTFLVLLVCLLSISIFRNLYIEKESLVDILAEKDPVLFIYTNNLNRADYFYLKKNNSEFKNYEDLELKLPTTIISRKENTVQLVTKYNELGFIKMNGKFVILRLDIVSESIE